MEALLKEFIGWVPMILLIAVWIFYMRKLRVPQNQSIEFLRKQLELTQHNNEIMERIAVSLENLSQKNQ